MSNQANSNDLQAAGENAKEAQGTSVLAQAVADGQGAGRKLGGGFSGTPLRKYFEAAVRYESSDIFLRSGQAPRLRLRGSLKTLDIPAIESEQLDNWIQQSISPYQWQHYLNHGSVDLGTDVEVADGTSHRFRLNIFRTRGRTAIVARRVNNKILSFEDLMLPASMRKICELRQGLILVCGITGSGKSTTLATMLQLINETRNCHILTIEDPIEYLFTDAKATVNQREVGIDLVSFEDGLRSMVRESPDVVLIGEMRDKETFEAALQAAETGHLVFGTIHASSAAQAFGRIYDLFPQEERDNVRSMLAYQMQAFIYQKLLPTIRDDIQRVPAVEILLQSPSTRKYILESRENELNVVIRDFRDAGMQGFTDALVELVEKQYIHPRTAQSAAFNPEEIKMRLKGIDTR